jgi:tetratricopeptide (TPR) repeat protein
MSARTRVTIVAAVVLVACLVGQALTVYHLDQIRPAATLEEVLYIPSAKVLQRLSLGYSGLLADIYWTRAVQYFGKKHNQRAARYDLLYPLLDITTTLDPHLVPAYEFGSTFLTQRPPEGAGQPHRAIELLNKGVQANQDNWRLWWAMGFVNYFELKDYLAAARALEKASTLPGAPDLQPVAGMMAQRGGDLETARRMWGITYQTAQQKDVKRNAERHLMAIDSDLFVMALEHSIRAFQEARGTTPQSWQELTAAGYGRGIPLDPLGNPYKLVDGRVELEHPEKMPFTTKGLPPGTEPTFGPAPDVQ